MTENLDRFEPEWPLPPPGDIIVDILEERNWTPEEFARRAGYTTGQANRLIRGEAAITQDTAFRLAQVLGGSIRFWLSIEEDCRRVATHSEKSQHSQNKTG